MGGAVTDGEACGWFELADIFEGGTGERCTSGKPATFRNCGFSDDVRVCEDHRCRCAKAALEKPTPMTPKTDDPFLSKPLLWGKHCRGPKCDDFNEQQPTCICGCAACVPPGARLIARCNISGNPCGTDTWGNGGTCHCTSCQGWLRAQGLSQIRREHCSSCGRERPPFIADPTCQNGGYCNWATVDK